MSLSVQNNSPSFSGTMLIPYSEVNKMGKASHKTMKKIGAETVKFAKLEDMQPSKEGILVKVDDSKEKEYQAVIAKFGVNVRKVDTPINKSEISPDFDAYKFMITKLNPKDAENRIIKFSKMDENAKGQEYINVYKEFKQSPYSQEKN